MRVLLSNSNLCYALFIPETVNIGKGTSSGPSRNVGHRHQRHHGWSRVRILHRLPIIFDTSNVLGGNAPSRHKKTPWLVAHLHITLAIYYSCFLIFGCLYSKYQT